MTLIALSSSSAVSDFIRANSCCLVTFSAHWCGPCKASKPQLESMAQKYASSFRMAIVYENDLQDEDDDGGGIQKYKIRAFPTYAVYEKEQEVQRVEGADLNAVEAMIQAHQHKATISNMPTSGGESLGGGGSSNVALSPAAARAARLAKLDASKSSSSTATPAAAAAVSCVEKKPAAAEKSEKKEPEDVEMKDADADTIMDSTTSADDKQNEKEDPLAKLDPQAIETLTSAMGFSLLRAQKGLLYGNKTVEGAIEWLMLHQDDDDIDEPIPVDTETGKAVVAQSYKCNECNKRFSNMANLELHANKTGHSDFQESTESVVPLTAEQKAAKIEEIKHLLAAKRMEREEAEKVDQKEREKQRRFMGKEMAKTREQLEMEQRKRDVMLKKREKEAFNKERLRLRAELAKDKAERKAQQGKLSSRLGVEGYNPDGIQYDVDVPGTSPAAASSGDDNEQQQQTKKKPKADASRIDEYISKISSYRAGGDGGKCLKVLKAYVQNVLDNPTESKFKTINMQNKAYLGKVKPFVGAKNILMAVGFQPNRGGDALLLNDEDVNEPLLVATKQKLEAAMAAYG